MISKAALDQTVFE